MTARLHKSVVGGRGGRFEKRKCRIGRGRPRRRGSGWWETMWGIDCGRRKGQGPRRKKEVGGRGKRVHWWGTREFCICKGGISMRVFNGEEGNRFSKTEKGRKT